MTIKIPKRIVYMLIGLVILLVILRIRSTSVNKPSDEKPIKSSVEVQEPTIVTKQNKINEIEVTARQFEFSPNPIRVKLGENVRLKITSVDVTHGFSIPEFNINETLKPGQTSTVEFQATKRGTFPFACSIQCGVGHSGMKGTFIIE